MLQIMARISACSVLVSAFLFGAQSHAQSLEEVLEQIGPPRSLEMTSEEYEQLKAFQGEGDPVKMLQRLEEARAALDAQKSYEKNLVSEAAQLQARVNDMNEALMANATAFGELLGQFRLAAERVGKKLDRSFTSFEYPGRNTALKQIASARTLPSRADLLLLPKTILQEMDAQSEVKTFTAEVVHASSGGRVEPTELLRVGVFQAATTRGSEFVILQKLPTGDGGLELKLVTFPGQSDEIRAAITALINAEPDDVVRTPIDPTRGSFFIKQVFGSRD